MKLPQRTLQYRLKSLVDAGRLIKEGEVRWAKYRLPAVVEAHGEVAAAVQAEGVGISLIAKLGVVIFVAGVVAGQHDLMFFGLLALVFRLVSHCLIIMERTGQNGWPVLLVSMTWGVLFTMTLAWLLRSVQQVFAH